MMKHLLSILIFLGLMSVNIYAESNVKGFNKSCPIYSFYFEDRKGITINEKAFWHFDTVEIQFKNNTISKVTKFNEMDNLFGTENNGLKKNINRALEKIAFESENDTYQSATHIFQADSGQFYKVKTTNSKKFNKNIYSVIEAYISLDETITGLVVVCSKDNDLISPKDFTSSIDVDLKDLKISLLNSMRDLNFISATEFEIRKNEIIKNKFPITKQLEQARALYRDGKFKCKKYQRRTKEILKIDHFSSECRAGLMYTGPIATGYLPRF